MSNEDQIAQVLGIIPNLTPEQVDSLTKFDTAPLDKAIEAAEANHGYSADDYLGIVRSSYVAIGVVMLARIAILGILANDSTLTAPWLDVVGGTLYQEVKAEAEVLSTPADNPVETVAPVVLEAPVEVPVVEPVVEPVAEVTPPADSGEGAI